MGTIIDLSSDTATRPSQEMLVAMMGSALGDEQKHDDPTTNALQERLADLLGKETALFLPSATMANQIAIKVHTRPGDEVIVERSAHIVISEGGGPAVLSGVMLNLVNGRRGMLTARQIEDAIRPADPHQPRTRLVCVEQTSNRGGGSVWPVELLNEVAAVAHRRGLATHMDGSRLMNAVVASGASAELHAEGYDSVTFCLTKGLGCPVGAVLVGGRDFMGEALRYKHMFGGAMRQSGVIAGAGLYALDHNVERLADDHANAKLLGKRLAEIPGIEVDPANIETNLVFFNVEGTGISGEAFVRQLAERGVRVGLYAAPGLIRAATHLGIARADVEAAAGAIAAIVEEQASRGSHRSAAVG